MYPENYNYIAIFSYDDDGISIEFPDLPGCLSCADTTEEAIESAKEALSLHLYGMECDKDEIPVPSDVKDLKLDKNEVPIMINVFMTPFREKMNNKFVKKTLSIPNWLNTIAEHENINFSKVLQNALKDYLKIKN